MGTGRRRRSAALALTLAACAFTGCALLPTTSPPSPPAVSAGEPLTLRTLADADFGATTLELGAVTADTANYTTTAVTYSSSGTTASGALSIPAGDGPHPGLVLVHGVVNPDNYVAGSGLAREQDYFARAGYVVLSLDLRSSTAAPTSAVALGVDLGATLDVVNGIRALQAAGLPTLDDSRISLLGHSMGGLLALNVIVSTPELVDAAIALSPASIDPSENVEYLTDLFGGTPTPIFQQYGTPQDNPGFWRDISPDSLVDRVETPLLIIHGTDDEITPFRGSKAIAAKWEEADKDVELVALEDEGHVFQSRWNEAMTLAAAFFDDELNG